MARLRYGVSSAVQAPRHRATMHTTDETTDFSSSTFFKCPPALPVAVKRAAQRNVTTASGFVRAAIIDKLSSDGVRPFEREGNAGRLD
jgi:hypothetical protein